MSRFLSKFWPPIDAVFAGNFAPGVADRAIGTAGGADPLCASLSVARENILVAKLPLIAGICWLVLASCVPLFRPSFRVLPATPNYLLRSPDARETPLAETLRNYNGFVPGNEWIDLRPQMELRVENAYYQRGMPRRGLNGYLGTEIARYKLQSGGGLKLLSFRSMKERPPGDLPVQELINSREMNYRFYQFYYEIFFRKSKNTRGSVLLGADTHDTIDRLARELQNNPEGVCNESSANCTVFPEACSVSVEMEISVNGRQRTIAWGSVLSDVVKQPHHIGFLRIYNGRVVPVKFRNTDAAALELPLLPGDQITWN